MMRCLRLVGIHSVSNTACSPSRTVLNKREGAWECNYVTVCKNSTHCCVGGVGIRVRLGLVECLSGPI